jgi:Ras-related protein Rab-1A
MPQEDTYSPKSPTLNAEFKLKSIVAEGHNIKLQMWDTAGQERFRTVSSSYYRGAHAVLVVYDVSEPKSLQSAGRLWLPEVDRYASSSVVKYLVGTKIDVDERKVSLEDAQKLADEWSLPFIETSSKTGEGVEELFVNACKMILRQMEVKPAPRRKLFHTLSMGDVPRKKKTCFI